MRQRSEALTSPTQHSRNGTQTPVTRAWVPEVPVALEFNGLAYAVMMATPADLDDFALGFALTEGLAATPADCTDIAVVEVEKGWIVRATLSTIGAAMGDGVERTALILVGPALAAEGFSDSRLYSADYDRRFRPNGARGRADG